MNCGKEYNANTLDLSARQFGDTGSLGEKLKLKQDCGEKAQVVESWEQLWKSSTGSRKKGLLKAITDHLNDCMVWGILSDSVSKQLAARSWTALRLKCLQDISPLVSQVFSHIAKLKWSGCPKMLLWTWKDQGLIEEWGCQGVTSI